MSPTHFCASSYRFRDIKMLSFTFNQYIKIMECNFRNYTIQFLHFLTSESRSWSGVQFSQLYHSIFTFFNFRKQIMVQNAIFANIPLSDKYQNLQLSSTHVFASFYHFRYIIFFKYFTFKQQVKVTECNFCNYTIRWQISKSTNV